MKNFFTYLFLISLCLILYYLGYLSVGIIERNPNVIVKQDLEYLWVKTYSLYNEETRRAIRVTRVYNIKQLVTVLAKVSKWYFDLRDVRLPGEEFAFDISVLRPEFWS